MHRREGLINFSSKTSFWYNEKLTQDAVCLETRKLNTFMKDGWQASIIMVKPYATCQLTMDKKFFPWGLLTE